MQVLLLKALLLVLLQTGLCPRVLCLRGFGPGLLLPRLLLR
jgi:hypothetical protein